MHKLIKRNRCSKQRCINYSIILLIANEVDIYYVESLKRVYLIWWQLLYINIKLLKKMLIEMNSKNWFIFLQTAKMWKSINIIVSKHQLEEETNPLEESPYGKHWNFFYYGISRCSYIPHISVFCHSFTTWKLNFKSKYSLKACKCIRYTNLKRYLHCFLPRKTSSKV